MPKHGWRWRTEQVGKLSREQLGSLFAQGHVSAKLARWIFENRRQDDFSIGAAALLRLMKDHDTPWVTSYLWRVLDKHRDEPVTEYAFAGLISRYSFAPSSIQRFIDLSRDESACDAVRGSALRAIGIAIIKARHHRHTWILSITPETTICEVCAAALVDANPHLRAGGISLAKNLGGFDGELDRLADDQTVLPGKGITVGSCVRPAEKDHVFLRVTFPEDLPTFFEQQFDPVANQMAAFTSPDPTDRAAFDAHWARVLANHSITKRTIWVDGKVAGYLVAFERFGLPEVGYWIGKDFWGRNITTHALRLFLSLLPQRPLYARVAHDNDASRRVLEKCVFVYNRTEEAFAAARNAVIEEFVFVLEPDAPSEPQSR